MPVQSGFIQTAHEDLITHACYDFYGTQLATCSLDKRIKIRVQDPDTSEWTITDDWKAHDAAVSHLSFAHPEFGAVLISGSFDRTIKVWERASSASFGVGSEADVTLGSRWEERAVIRDARGTVREVEFAPNWFGLKFASISTDNTLRVYDCLELPSLGAWLISEELDLPNFLSSPPSTIVNASISGAASTAQSSSDKDELPNAKSVNGANKEADGGWALSWCHDRQWGPLLAIVASSHSAAVQIIGLSPARKLLILSSHSTSSDHEVLTCVAWAPSCGRSYQLVASASRSGKVWIWKLHPPQDTYFDENDDRDDDMEPKQNNSEGLSGEGKWSCEELACFDSHGSMVGSVEWNITGTILSSSGADGKIRLWTAAAGGGGRWGAAGSIGVEQALGSGAGDIMEE